MKMTAYLTNTELDIGERQMIMYEQGLKLPKLYLTVENEKSLNKATHLQHLIYCTPQLVDGVNYQNGRIVKTSVNYKTEF